MCVRIFFYRYDTEATYFEEGVRSSKRQQLQEKLLQVMHILLTYDFYTCVLFDVAISRAWKHSRLASLYKSRYLVLGTNFLLSYPACSTNFPRRAWTFEIWST